MKTKLHRPNPNPACFPLAHGRPFALRQSLAGAIPFINRIFRYFPSNDLP
jgi:hypothetical protein